MVPPRPPVPTRAVVGAEPLAAGLPARRQAALLLEAALARRSGLDEAAASAAFRALDPRDRGFARQAALTTLRRLGAIDRALAARLKSPPPLAITTLLRLGIAQAWFMDVPEFAAVNATVDQAQAAPGTRPFKNLVNAVLRAALREGRPADDPEVHAPPWLFARWSAAYGRDAARAIAAEIVREPPTDLTCRAPAEAESTAALLDGATLADGTIRTSRRGDVAAWPGYAEGGWWVQDAAAAVPARLLRLKPGETALDLCAAPGGKTLQLAATGARVTALDRSAARLHRLRDNLRRTRLEAEVITADALTWSDPRQYDAVLLDAPCSSSGTFRRNPDVLWGLSPADIAKLAAAQRSLLDAAARQVAPGGRLVYCVCSLEPEEGEGQVAPFLARHPDFNIDPAAPGEGGAPAEALRPEGWLRILPSQMAEIGGLDGFFAVRLIRRA